jgi:hypothetical protein
VEERKEESFLKAMKKLNVTNPLFSIPRDRCGGVGLLKKESFIRKSLLFQKKLWQKQALRKSLDQKQALRKTSFLRKSKLFKKKLYQKQAF